ncbi:hypothetical protein GOP47_0008522 [Adiantum capillus-veneris]|uniref:Uncharacterized protein n=1 Tax=Adiantum capillus-veneris TaxID=13818 RepID=A0A9D4UZA5_ADICA|nr:hypothetical protein GOP47_0008522 [Adiantum capillus-veneris]
MWKLQEEAREEEGRRKGKGSRDVLSLSLFICEKAGEEEGRRKSKGSKDVVSLSLFICVQSREITIISRGNMSQNDDMA